MLDYYALTGECHEPVDLRVRPDGRGLAAWVAGGLPGRVLVRGPREGRVVEAAVVLGEGRRGAARLGVADQLLEVAARAVRAEPLGRGAVALARLQYLAMFLGATS